MPRAGTPPRNTGSPSRMPEGTPEFASPTDHSWTLQAVMEMHKTVGVLCEKVDRLSADVTSLNAKIDDHGDKLDGLRHWQTRLTTAAAVLAAVVAIVWTVMNVVPWDRIRLDPAQPEQSRADRQG